MSDLKSEEDGVAFQLKLMDMQMFLEDTFCELAERTGQVHPNHHPNPIPNPNPTPTPKERLHPRACHTPQVMRVLRNKKDKFAGSSRPWIPGGGSLPGL